MKKKIPSFKSDRAAEAFVVTADLSEYDLSGAPEQLLDAVYTEAERAGMPYQRFIRLMLERAIHPKP
jgi:predicted DNA binding CopG/RHH family protein